MRDVAEIYMCKKMRKEVEVLEMEGVEMCFKEQSTFLF